MRVTRWAGLLVLLLISAHAGADTVLRYAIDPARTVINFTWHYLGRESPKASFSNPSGMIYLNTDDPLRSRTEVSIPVRTLSTFMRVIDRELLQSGNFFLPEKYPAITFRSTGITPSTSGDTAYRVAGTLTANGISQPVVLLARPVGLQLGQVPGTEMTIEASTRFRRSQFGMTRMLGIVGDDMSISLKVVAVRRE
jgi:polyisoprenoid-binding protein YceI